MAWVALTVADLEDGAPGALVGVLQSAALGGGQTDPAPRAVANAVQRVRDEIAACEGNVLDADTNKVPAGTLHAIARRLALSELRQRLGELGTDEDREQLRSDEKYLSRVASCQIGVSPTDNPATEPSAQVAGALPSIRPRCRPSDCCDSYPSRYRGGPYEACC